jgi:hypothetical protein
MLLILLLLLFMILMKVISHGNYLGTGSWSSTDIGGNHTQMWRDNQEPIYGYGGFD